MKQPKFWYKEGSLLKIILAPFGFLHGFIVKWRIDHTKPYKPNIPVVCIGNISVGGTGKTPVCLALADYFHLQGRNVYFLSHGYKSRLQNVLIDTRTHTSADVSDEALLFAEKMPTIVNRNRAEGVQKAEKLGADMVIMDDGFQNPTLQKDCSLIVFDGRRGIGNGGCIPSGPLRESLRQGLKRASGVVIVGPDKTGLEEKIKKISPKKTILKGHIEPVVNLSDAHQGIAFAGIGNPDKFFDMLEEYGVDLKEKIPFPDHYNYKRQDIEKLLKKGYPLFTTRKDAVKIDTDLQEKLGIVDIVFIFDESEKWDAFWKEKLK